jgi:hypothetical protein
MTLVFQDSSSELAIKSTWMKGKTVQSHHSTQSDSLPSKDNANESVVTHHIAVLQTD